MSTLALAAVSPAVRRHRKDVSRQIDAVLLGLGTIGTAVARLAGVRPLSDRGLTPRVRISAALVRNVRRDRRGLLPDGALLTADPRDVLARRPDVFVEVLGGTEPARTLVSAALANGIPVVTANKSLLAAHGDELFDLAAATGTPLRYEAAVLAGVPFLGAPRHRVHASGVTGLTGIVNGTSNFILTRMREASVACAAAVAEAQRLGLAEPDPGNDVEGIDAAEKLAVLLRHYGCASIDAAALERTGIDALGSDDLEHAHAFGGVLKPIATAALTGDFLEAFVGPAFLPATHRLARIDGVENGLVVRNGYGTLFFSGPGAGPTPTAASVLNDVLEIASGGTQAAYERATSPRLTPVAPVTEWFVRISGTPVLPGPADVSDLLGAYGVWLLRSSGTDSREGRASRWLLTLPVERPRLERALHALRAACGCETTAVRALETV